MHMKNVVLLMQLLVAISTTTASTSTGCNITSNVNAPTYPANGILFNVSLIENCECSDVKAHICIRKCCEVNYVLNDKQCVLNHSDFNVILRAQKVIQVKHDIVVSFLSGALKCGGHYVLNVSEFALQEDGRIVEYGVPEAINYHEFCIDSYNGKFSALVCFPEEQIHQDTVEFIKILGMLVSVPFLLATFIIYALLPSRKLHGNALMCYVISLLGGFTLLAVIRLNKFGFSQAACVSVAVPCIFFFLASFFWMNVMSIDIWWTFSGLGGFKGNRRDAENKRFILYSAYAWGVPLVLGIAITVLSLTTLVPSDAWYNPGVGHGTACWFREALQELIYFYGLLTVLTITNVILFAITAYKIRQAHKDTAMLRKSDSQKHGDDSDTQRFSLYVKLLLVMGLNWSMEIISYVVDWQVGEVPPAVWYITDFCNALYGVLIFFLFCFNKKTWVLLKSRFVKPDTSRFSTQSTVAETRPLKSS